MLAYHKLQECSCKYWILELDQRCPVKWCARNVGGCRVGGVEPVVSFCLACSFGTFHILAHTLSCHPSCLAINIVVPLIPGFFLFLGVWLVANHGVLPGFCALVKGVPRFFI